MRHLLRLSLPSFLFVFLFTTSAHAQKWTQPTPEELSMTEQPGAPGANAVYLDREEVTDDDTRTTTYTYRIKILTEAGLDMAKIRLTGFQDKDGKARSVESFSGRTIHADGTVIPLTDPPARTSSSAQDGKTTTSVYQLPQPQVGSILEYRFTLRTDGYIKPPYWPVQSALYTRHADFLWMLTNVHLQQLPKGVLTRSISEVLPFQQLPTGTSVKNIQRDHREGFELEVSDIPALPKAEFLPPSSSFAYKMEFFYTPYTTADQFWKNTGESWSRDRNHLIGPGSAVKAAVAKLIAPSDTSEQKLRKLYAAVMELDNLSIDRDLGGTRDGTDSDTRTADQVLTSRRGNNDQIDSLFLAMARAAGFKAYDMRVSLRSRNIFTTSRTTFEQLTDDIAIVELDGKEIFLDPGTRFCPFGYLATGHAGVGGIRQTDSGTALASTPNNPASMYTVRRTANLTVDEKGEITGSVTLTHIALSGIYWRQFAAVRGYQALHEAIKKDFASQMSDGMQMEIESVDNLSDPEKSLVIHATLKGSLDRIQNKLLLLPVNIFLVRDKQLFQPETREQPVLFPYAETLLDVIHLNLPSTLAVSSLPKNSTQRLANDISFQLRFESTPSSVTIWRSFARGRLLYPASSYPELHSFFADLYNSEHAAIALAPAAAKD